MKGIKGLGIRLFLLLVMCITFINPVFAANGDGVAIKIPSSDSAAFSDLFTDGDDAAEFVESIKMEMQAGKGDESTPICSFNGTTLTFDYMSFKNATEKSRKNAIKHFVNALKDSNVSDQTQQMVFDRMTEADSDVAALMIPLVFDSTKADVYTAYKWLSPALNSLRKVFGVAAIAIIVLVIISTIIDLVFMGLPFNRDSKEGKRPIWISPEAYSTIKECESSLDSSGGYKNAYFLYFKRRFVTYIILSICILYLVLGQIGTLISWFMSLGGGLFE